MVVPGQLRDLSGHNVVGRELSSLYINGYIRIMQSKVTEAEMI